MTNRFSVKYGKFGAYFFDEHDKKELSLEDVKLLLNEYIPPALPKTPAFIKESTVMDGNNFSIHTGMAFR